MADGENDARMPDRPLSEEERHAIARAEAAIAGLAGRYRESAAADLARLKTAAADLAADPAGRATHLERVFAVAHDMKGQGATFGYSGVTTIGDQLCRFIQTHRETLDDADVAEVLRQIEALANKFR